MFTSASPILAADDPHSAHALALVTRLAALHVVLGAVAQISGAAPDPVEDPLAVSADFTGAIARLSPIATRQLAARCDSLSMMLQAGLIALQRARVAGRSNHAACVLLHTESREAMDAILQAARGAS